VVPIPPENPQFSLGGIPKFPPAGYPPGWKKLLSACRLPYPTSAFHNPGSTFAAASLVFVLQQNTTTFSQEVHSIHLTWCRVVFGNMKNNSDYHLWLKNDSTNQR